MSRMHYVVLVRGRIGMAGMMDTMVVVHIHNAAWVEHCCVPIRSHMHVPALGWDPKGVQSMESLLVGVHTIVIAVCLNGSQTQTHESSHRQDRSGTAATSTHRLGGTLAHGQTMVLVGGP
jgi:hypothetical protein